MRALLIKLLPDGSGRVRIHWFIHDAAGPIKTTGNVLPTAAGILRLGGAIGRIACDPDKESVATVVDGQKHIPYVHSNDPRAATCPECIATKEYVEAMKKLGEVLETSGAK